MYIYIYTYIHMLCVYIYIYIYTYTYTYIYIHIHSVWNTYPAKDEAPGERRRRLLRCRGGTTNHATVRTMHTTTNSN